MGSLSLSQNRPRGCDRAPQHRDVQTRAEHILCEKEMSIFCFDPLRWWLAEMDIYLVLLIMQMLVCLIVVMHVVVMVMCDRRGAVVPSPLWAVLGRGQ